MLKMSITSKTGVYRNFVASLFIVVLFGISLADMLNKRFIINSERCSGINTRSARKYTNCTFSTQLA